MLYSKLPAFVFRIWKQHSDERGVTLRLDVSRKKSSVYQTIRFSRGVETSFRTFVTRWKSIWFLTFFCDLPYRALIISYKKRCFSFWKSMNGFINSFCLKYNTLDRLCGTTSNFRNEDCTFLSFKVFTTCKQSFDDPRNSCKSNSSMRPAF